MKVQTDVNLNFELIFKLTEEEAEALHALTVYGTKSFLDTFYRFMGTSYLKPYERGLISLFENVSRQIPSLLKDVHAARELIKTLQR